MLSFLMISGLYSLYGGHIPSVVPLPAIPVCLYTLKKEEKGGLNICCLK